jgi:glucokinase
VTQPGVGGGPAAAAVDIGGTKLSVAIVCPDGELLGFATRASRGVSPREAVAWAHEALSSAAQEAARDGWRLATLGVGATGRHDQRSGRFGAIDAVLPGWGGSDLPLQLAERLSAPLGGLLNDADAAAIAEGRIGAGRGADPCVAVTIGTGIGVALLHQGRPSTGASGGHGEFGHTTIAFDGPSCMCGAVGCWESFAGGGAMERAWLQSSASDPEAGGSAISATEIFDRAARGDARADEIVSRAVRATALGIANLAVAYAPEVIVIGGGLAARWPRYAPHVSEELERRAPIMIAAPRIALAAFGSNAVLVGAGISALDTVSRT